MDRGDDIATRVQFLDGNWDKNKATNPTHVSKIVAKAPLAAFVRLLHFLISNARNVCAIFFCVRRVGVWIGRSFSIRSFDEREACLPFNQSKAFEYNCII